VDGLACTDLSGNLNCSNWNPDENGVMVSAFHEPSRCVLPNLDHSWVGTHKEANFSNPNSQDFLGDGFIRVNDATEQVDRGNENATEDQTMGYYTQNDIPFYYDLAQKFALSDRYFASVLGPTFPNRSYLMAATSFGHLTTNDTFPPPGGYKPITGTIFDLLNKYGVSWADYFQGAPQAASFFPSPAHFLPLFVFLAQAAGLPGVDFREGEH
jgi:phospholipase C